MDIKELYEKIGGNYESALSRLIKESFVEKFALMYLKDTSFLDLSKAVSEGNIVKSFRAAHTLKGVAANLSFNELSEAASELTEQLRSQTELANPHLYKKVKTAHNKTLQVLEEYQTLNSK